MRQSLPLMHFYSGKLLQFYSGVDSVKLPNGEAASGGKPAEGVGEPAG
jgi:hypothetical protein